jgi:hypothetical protein
MEKVIRYNGKWYKINSSKYESEHQTFLIANLLLKDNLTSEDAYIKYYENLRSEHKLLYPEFHKCNKNSGSH